MLMTKFIKLIFKLLYLFLQLNMLLRLQEAANYADKDGQESDCASLDSNFTQDSSAGAE